MNETEEQIRKNIVRLSAECDLWRDRARGGSVRMAVAFVGTMIGLIAGFTPLFWAGLVLQVANLIHGKIRIFRPWHATILKLGHEHAKLTGRPFRPEDIGL